MDLEGLGKAISEAIALRQLIASTDGRIRDAQLKIDANEKETARLETLKLETESLVLEKNAFGKELEEQKDELKKRVVKLNKVGVALPIDKEMPKGIVSL